MPQPPRPDGWKHGSPAPRKDAPGPSRKAWQPGAAAPKPTGRKKSRVVSFLIAGTIVGVLAALVGYFVLIPTPPKYASLVIVAPDADTLAVPENAAGLTGATALADWCRSGESRPKLAADPISTRDWADKLDRGAKATVLYFAAHGGADATGPYLWLPPKPDTTLSDADKLPVREILTRLAERLPPEQPKLLVFDLARTPPNWVHGGAFADFARAVKELDAEIDKHPGLAVVVSNDAGQVSWTAEDARKSVFAVWFLETIRGAGHQIGDKVTAASAYKVLREEVQKWAVANREANQTPLLLPEKDGEARAGQVELATVLEGHQKPPTADPPTATPKPLADEWAEVEKLLARSPALDTTHPQQWREYLDWMLRWDRLHRLNANVGQIPERVAALRRDMTKPDGGELAAATVALPAGRVLGSAADATDVAFDRLWTPTAPETHSTEWERLLKVNARREPAVRAALARFVLKQVLDGPTPATLATAEGVLAATGESTLLPVELHVVRMLRKHLDEKRPDAELLRTALRTRQDAETAAWADDATARGYTEQVYRWTRPQIEKADAERQDAEDLLFDVKPESWVQAAKLFQQAADGYRAARERGRVVAGALAKRDRTFARLPFYARWLAGYRGPMLPNEAGKVDKLVSDVERAAKYAHDADKILRAPPTDPVAIEAKVKELAALPDAGALAEIEKAHRDEVSQLTNQAQESNWHALDGALSVPFVVGELRAKLIGFVGQVGFRLATNTQQQAGAQAKDPEARTVARKHLRAAGLYLGEPAERFADGERDPAWWKVARASADDLGKRFRDHPSVAATTADRVTKSSKPLADTTGDLADAARLARLSDPAAPLTVDPRPPLAERLYWRHRFLLGQAARTIVDGWCVADAGETDPERWYCRKAAGELIAAARLDVRRVEPAPNPLPPVLARLFAECDAEAKRQPTVLNVSVLPLLDVVQDDPGIPFTFGVGYTGERIGFPVSELVLPPNLRETNAARLGRKLETRLKTMPKADTPLTLNPGPKPERVAPPLVTAVLYRGRKYEMKTEINFSGPPNLEWVHTPPKGDAVMALVAEPKAIAGTVTLLIDRSYSMVDPKQNPRGQPTRLEKAIEGVELLLREIPEGTTVTIGTFVGIGNQREVVQVVEPFVVRGTKEQRERVMKPVNDIRAQEANSNTPVAGAIKDAFDPLVGKKLWPTNYTGARTLIVLTDGEDNWAELYRTSPGDVVRDVLRKSLADVPVHRVLFWMEEAERKRAVGQFESLEERDADRDASVEFTLWRDVRDGAAFARALQAAVMPRVRYAGGKEAGILKATSPALREYNPSKALPRDSYTLTGAKGLPQVQLEPGDRVLLRAGAFDAGVKLTIPPIAHELAGRGGVPREMTEKGGAKVYLTVPEFKVEPKVETVDLKMTATLESELGTADPKLLQIVHPLVAWFDVTDPEGKVTDAAKLRMKVENRPGLIAPAWNLTLTNWDTNNPNGPVRPPVVTGYWVDGRPTGLGAPKMNLRNLEQSVREVKDAKTFAAGGGNVELQTAALSDVNGEKFLTVWFKYGKPGDLIFARATGWGEELKRPVAERHAYYDPQARYTVKFGPLSPAQADAVVTLELFSVAALRERARQTGRSVSYSFVGRKLDPIALPSTLQMNPAK